MINEIQLPPKIETPSAEFLEQWPEIRKHFRRCQKAGTFVSLATVRPDGSPAVSPIGSFWLDQGPTGSYLEKFTTSVPRHKKSPVRVSVMAVDSRFSFWFKGLWKGYFPGPAAVRLLGYAGELREATEEERNRFLKQVRLVKGWKGYKNMWAGMSHLREIHFDGWEPARLGKMDRPPK